MPSELNPLTTVPMVTIQALFARAEAAEAALTRKTAECEGLMRETCVVYAEMDKWLRMNFRGPTADLVRSWYDRLEAATYEPLAVLAQSEEVGREPE